MADKIVALIIEDSCSVAASAEQVFSAICDLSQYAQWNPWIVAAEGDIALGNEINVQVLFGKKKNSYRHKILRYQAPNKLLWCDVGLFTYVAYGERERTLTERDGQTHYHVQLRVTGCLAFLVAWLYGKALRQGLSSETQALKQWVESRG